MDGAGSLESAGPSGATLQLLQEAQRKMGLEDGDHEESELRSRVSRLASRCWALLLMRIYECLPLLCLSCNRPMRILAFIQDPPVIEKILRHIGEPTQPPKLLPVRSPPQREMELHAETTTDPWPEMDQTQGVDDAGWD